MGEDYVKDNLIDVADNAAAISSNDGDILSIEDDVAGAIVDIADNKVDVADNAAAISSNDGDILSIEDDVAEATRCTSVGWSGSYDCCTSANPCSIGQGDCNSGDHTTCSGDLKCGINNCLSEFGFGDSSADCCILV